MRLMTEIWVKAYLRRCAGVGVPAVVVRHGDDQAGTVYIKVALLNGTAVLYGPAPAGMEQSRDRRFIAVLGEAPVPEEKVEAHLARQYDFDPDIWVLEIEDRVGRHFLDDWLMDDRRGE